MLDSVQEKIIIIGLGNIGSQYDNTRHNVGFLFLDFFQNNSKFPEFKEESKFNSFVTSQHEDNIKIVIAKPTTLMNNSGRAVRSLCNFYKISPSKIIVIHDDLDIEFGKFKIQEEKGPRGHNGILSIENDLGTKIFKRIRIGVENRTKELKENMSGRDYVLMKFSTIELKQLKEDVFPDLYTKLDSLILGINQS